MAGSGEWDEEADNWVRWARTPGHDAYWFYRDAFFEDLVPVPGRRTLEVGCGEGRVARDLVARGHRVVALDSAAPLLRAAQDEDRRASYLQADSAALPFADRSFDLVVAYNSLQVVGDMRGTIAETARVLDVGGRFCVCVSHPVADLGRFLSDADEADYMIRPGYFQSERVDETVERAGLTMRFRGWTYPLTGYFSALEAAGLLVDAVREPRPRGGSDSYKRFERVPMFMNLRATKA